MTLAQCGSAEPPVVTQFMGILQYYNIYNWDNIELGSKVMFPDVFFFFSLQLCILCGVGSWFKRSFTEFNLG